MEEQIDLIFRTGEASDIPFLIDTIVAAEKSGTEKFSYSTLFEIPEEEVRKTFRTILEEDVRGQELCYSDYLVAWAGTKRAGAVAAWIEGETGQSSSVIKAMLLNFHFPKENMEKAVAKRKVLETIRFDPEPGSLVIDIGLTLPEFRGQGILKKLMMEQTRRHLEKRPDLRKSQIHVLQNNTVAFKIYSSLGYRILREKKCPDPVILNWLPSDTQIIMEKNF